MSTYAIIGAAGKVGFATSSALRETGVSVRAILRDESKAARLRSIGCEIAIADLQDVDALTKAIRAVEALQIIIPLSPGADDPAEDARKTMECVATAVEQANPKRLLAISDYGAHVPRDIGIPSMFRTFEERLGRLNGNKIFLRSAEHMENWARSIPSAIDSGILSTFIDPVDKPLPIIFAPDLGKIAAQLLLLPTDSEDTKIVHAEGPQKYSSSDVAKALGEMLDRTVEVQSVPRSQWDNVFGQVAKPSLAELLIKTNDAQNDEGLIDVEPGSIEVRYGTTELAEALRTIVRP